MGFLPLPPIELVVPTLLHLQAELIFKVHKLRLQFIPKKLQRVHSSQVVAVRCHDQKPHIFATGGWDRTLRVRVLRLSSTKSS